MECGEHDYYTEEDVEFVLPCEVYFCVDEKCVVYGRKNDYGKDLL